MTDAASHGALTALYTAALGHGPKERYLRRFAQFDATGRTAPGWNGAASLCTVGWAMLRHLWVPTLLYVAVLEGLALLALGPGRWLLPQQMHLPALLAIAALAWVLPGMYGDALLHTEIRKRIVTALTQTQSVAEACTFLAQRASTSQRVRKLALAHAAVAVVVAAGTALSVWQPWHNTPPSAAAQTTRSTGPEQTAQEALLQSSSVVATPFADADTLPATAPTPAATDPAPITEPHSTFAAAKDEATPSAPPKTKPSTSSAESPPAQPPPALAAATQARNAPSPSAPQPLPAASARQDTVPAQPGSQPGYYLNAGLFAEEANARKVQAELLNANLPAFRQSLKTPQGERIRVRIGPFSTKRQADAQRQTLRGMGLEAVVFRQ